MPVRLEQQEWRKLTLMDRKDQPALLDRQARLDRQVHLVYAEEQGLLELQDQQVVNATTTTTTRTMTVKDLSVRPVLLAPLELLVQ